MDLIKLQSSHVNQYTSNGVKSDWEIQENVTNYGMGYLPGRLNEKEIFSILDIARKYELEAFNVGIQFGKEEQKKIARTQFNEYESRIRLIHQENERLATTLEILTNKN